MRSRRLLPLLFLFVWTGSFSAETVVDVTSEWNAHLSSSTAPHTGSARRVPAAPRKAVVEEVPNSCQCEDLTTPERLEQSTYAFTGRVAEVRAAKKGKRVIVFDVEEIFKGSPKPEMRVVEEVTGTDCDIAYAPEQFYVVFAKWQWGSVVTSRCMGTKFLEKMKTAELGPSEALKEKLYIRLRNGCMGRRDTACCLSSIKGMQAGYFVPEPEEGCPAATIPDRLRCAGSYTWCIPVLEKGHR